MYVYMILMMPKKNQTRLLQRICNASRLIQDCFNKQSFVSRFTKDQALPQNKVFPRHPRLWVMLKRVLNLNFEPVIDYQIFAIDY